MSQELVSKGQMSAKGTRLEFCRRLRLLRATAHSEVLQQGWRVALRDSGATLVETAISASVVLMLLFGVMEMSLAFYTFCFVSDAAREATRYAIVRGSTSCTNTPSLTNCDATSAEIQTYVQNLGYPGLKTAKLAATTTWLTESSSGSPSTTKWLACTSGTCNAPGNVARVVVTYAFPLNIPFWRTTTISVSSTSQMVVSQ